MPRDKIVESPARSIARIMGLVLGTGAIVFATTGAKADRARAPQVISFSELENFDAIELSGSDKVIVTQAAHYAVQAEGNPAEVAKLRFDLRGGTLHIGRRPGNRAWSERDKGVTVHIALPALHSVKLTCSGDLHADRLPGDAVQARVTGSGDLHIGKIDAGRAQLTLAGSGGIVAGGTVGALVVSIAGSGNVRAAGLNAGSAEIAIAGSGGATVHASGRADVSIVGSGDATIRGTADCRISKAGSGDARCAV